MARPIHVLECAFASSPDTALASQVWTDISAYLDVQAGVKINRGRSDEFSDVSPGSMGLTLKNADGRFTMGQTSGPYYPNVVPGKRIRYGLMWPGGGKNLAPNVTSSADGTGWSGTGSVPPTVVMDNAVAPPVGTHMLKITWGTGGSVPAGSLTLVGLVIGKQYTVSGQCFVPSGGSPAILLGIAGIVDGSPTTVTNALQLRTVTFTATANTHFLRVRPNTAATAGQIGRVGDLQVEEGGSATSFVNTPGTFAWRFTGDVNEWPLSFVGGPAAYAETNLTASDRLSRLGDLGEFQSTLAEAILKPGPFAYYPLNEGALATSVADVSVNAQPAMAPFQIGSGGTFELGSDTYTVGGTDFSSQPAFYASGGGGAAGTGAWFSQASAGNGKFLRTALSAPRAAATGASIVAFPGPGGAVLVGTLASMQAADGSYFSLEMDGSVNVNGVFFDSLTGTKTTVLLAPGFLDPPAQYAATLTNLGTGNWRLDTYLSGVLANTTTFAVARAMPAWSAVSIGARTKDVLTFIASHVAFYDLPVAAADLAIQSAAAQLGQTALGMESTASRLAALAGFAGLDTMVTRGTGTPKTAGPQEIAGSPLDAFAKVADTEAGLFLIQADGFPTFHLATYRYNVAASLALAADRLDPNALTFRGDNFGVYDDVTATGSSGVVGRAVNPAGIAAYGRRKGTVDTLGVDAASLYSSAARLAFGFGTARNRITGVRFSPLNDVALIAGALGLDIGEKITITALPTQAPASSVDLFVEGYAETVSEDDWSMTLNTSPAEPWNVWQLGVAGRSELGSTTILGY
jgi:hypothetical protein